MYFGSVKFFKHLIAIVILLLIALSITYVVILSKDNEKLKEEIVQISERTMPVSSPEDSPLNNAATAANDEAEEDENEPPPKEVGLYGHLYPDLYATSFGSNEEIEYVDDSDYIYLTFDDGPSANTITILNYLRDYGVKATFFVVPNEGHLYLLDRIVNEGHAIGVHSNTHNYQKIYASVEAFLEDFNAIRTLIYEQTGVLTDIYRFPGGSINSYNKEIREDIIEEMSRRGFVYFDWNIDSGDWRGYDWETMYYGVREDVENIVTSGKRPIVLFHDAPGARYTTWVIGDLIDDFLKNPRGYRFGTLSPNVKPVQW